MKIETHLHTKEGSPDGIVSAEQTIEILIKKGYDGMIVTDHNSYKGYESIDKSKYDNFVILKGVEYDTSDAGHMLIILPSDNNSTIFTHKGMNIKDTIQIVHALGGIIGPAHPFDYYRLGIFNNVKKFKNFNIMKEFDFVEAFNSCGSLLGNDKSSLLSQMFNKPSTGGSDSHKKESVGSAATILPKRVENESEYIDLIKNLAHKGTEVIGELYMGTSKEKLGALYSVGMRIFYSYSKVSGLYTKRKALKEASLLSLL